ncbi:tetratricopeptide repeat protein [Planctomycetota bacterium]
MNENFGASGAANDYSPPPATHVPDIAQAYRKEADDCNNTGIEHLSHMRFEKALQSFNQALDLDPGFVAAHINRARANTQIGDYASAVTDCNNAIKLAPKSVAAHSYRARAKYRQQQYDAALVDCNFALNIDPKYAMAYFHRAHIYIYNNKVDQGIKDLNRALKLEPNSAIYLCSRGWAKYRKKDFRGTIEDCTRAINSDPNWVYSYKWRAAAHRALGNKTKAKADEQKMNAVYQHLLNS